AAEGLGASARVKNPPSPRALANGPAPLPQDAVIGKARLEPLAGGPLRLAIRPRHRGAILLALDGEVLLKMTEGHRSRQPGELQGSLHQLITHSGARRSDRAARPCTRGRARSQSPPGRRTPP